MAGASHTPESVAALLARQAEEVAALMTAMCGRTRLVPPARAGGVYRSGGAVVLHTAFAKWDEPDAEGLRLQARAQEAYARFHELHACLVRGKPGRIQAELKHARLTVTRFLELSPCGESSTAEKELGRAVEAVRQQARSLAELFDGGRGGERIVVPDTNALLYNPAIDQWRFDCRFTLMLTPTILSELDKLKVSGNDRVQPKAERLIRQVKDYRWRGKLTEGVTLARDVSKIAAIAVEPDFATTLPWLKSDNSDDRLLASVIEVMRSFPHAAVALVTRDINLQSKAELATVPFCEPPDPN
jgi:hypothetical protein